MRKGSIALVVALMIAMMMGTPVQANIGTSCGGWKATVSGGFENACYIRSANWEIAGRGKGYYVGSARLDQMNISVTLQTSMDGMNWSPVTSRSCGFTDIPSEPPGGLCTTAARYIEAGALYRSRVFLILFGRDGSVTATAPTYSPVTS
jgi:hypothetical protein